MSAVEKVKISVIVPVYNVEEYLPVCLNSILDQTYPVYELILVDDGSEDNSGIICEQYAKKDSRIKVIHKKNGGLSSARNAGIDIADGSYIAFIDSDDVVHPEYLERMLLTAKKENADIVACHFIKGENCQWKPLKTGKEIRVGSQILDKMNVDDVVVTVAWNKLYRRELFINTELRYPEGKIHEDMFLTPQLLYHAKKMVLISEELYFYRQRPDSIMSASFSTKKLQSLEAIEFRILFFQKIGKKNIETREYESYIRKTIQLYSEMSQVSGYDQEKKQIFDKLMTICASNKVFWRLNIKYKLKLLMFCFSVKTGRI